MNKIKISKRRIGIVKNYLNKNEDTGNNYVLVKGLPRVLYVK